MTVIFGNALGKRDSSSSGKVLVWEDGSDASGGTDVVPIRGKNAGSISADSSWDNS